jgi:hypothetical protein
MANPNDGFCAADWGAIMSRSRLRRMHTHHMTNSCGATTLWAREFWSEIVNRRSILSRHRDEVDLLGWKVRLAWDEGADRGTLYVRPPQRR